MLHFSFRRPPFILFLYRALWAFLLPVSALFLGWRLLQGKEDFRRLKERFGLPSFPKRPNGPVVWIHGASVGETLSVIPLIQRLLAERSDCFVLVTSGTKTSAKLLRSALPERAVHQYLPLDFYPFVRLFLGFWQPAVSVFIESEFWPEALWQAPNPLLVNARMSERSFGRYFKLRRLVLPFLARFHACLAQTEQDAERLATVGAHHVQTAGNLKFDVPPLQADEALLSAFKKAIGNRPVLVAASTHSGEEEVIAALHARLRDETLPELLTVLVPRHPNRGDTVTALVRTLLPEAPVAQRRHTPLPAADTQIFVADTIGEMGVWYRLAHAVVMGGSFIPHGGQNPLEPLKLGATVFTGPYTHNFKQIIQFLRARGLITVADTPETLFERLSAFFTAESQESESVRAQRQAQTLAAMDTLSGATQRALEAVLRVLPAPR